FSRHHALQCGFCTPGMLATARDIVLRLPDADEERIRVELSGNLCRCTGYMGIVAAVRSVLQELREEPVPEVEALRKAARDGAAVVPQAAVATTAAAAGAGFTGFDAAVETATAPRRAAAVPPAGVAATDATATEAAAASEGAAAGKGAGKGQHIDGSFEVPFPADRVWAFMV